MGNMNRDFKHGPPDHKPEALPTRLSGPGCYDATNITLATSFTSE